jgi:hypothetical protein
MISSYSKEILIGKIQIAPKFARFQGISFSKLPNLYDKLQ